MKKKITSLMLSLILCFAMSASVFAAEPNSTDVKSDVSVEGSSESVSTRTISGYGQVTNVSNTSSQFSVPVTVTSGNGFGLTIKTSGSGYVTVAVRKPQGGYLSLGSGFNNKNWTFNGTGEKQKNFTGIQSGSYIVEYSVIGGPSSIYCHIYG